MKKRIRKSGEMSDDAMEKKIKERGEVKYIRGKKKSGLKSMKQIKKTRVSVRSFVKKKGKKENIHEFSWPLDSRSINSSYQFVIRHAMFLQL